MRAWVPRAYRRRIVTETFLVEHYWPGVTEASFRGAVDQVRVATERLAANGESITFMHSTLVLEDENALCVFSADSQRVVEEAYARAGVRFERIVSALELEAIGSPNKEDQS